MRKRATVIDEPPQSHDTSRSWRVMKHVLVWLISIISLAIGFGEGYENKRIGDSETRIGEVEDALRDYVRAADKTGRTSLSLYLEHESSFRAEARLYSAKWNLEDSENHRHATAFIRQAIAKYNFSKSSDEKDLRIHSYDELKDLERPWIVSNTFESVIKGIWFGVLCGVGGWITTWLLLVGLALLWWFLMDRLRDISRAIRG
jgi:hypothetical protein